MFVKAGNKYKYNKGRKMSLTVSITVQQNQSFSRNNNERKYRLIKAFLPLFIYTVINSDSRFELQIPSQVRNVRFDFEFINRHSMYMKFVVNENL